MSRGMARRWASPESVQQHSRPRESSAFPATQAVTLYSAPFHGGLRFQAGAISSGHTRSLWGTSKLPHGTTTPSQVSLQHETFTHSPGLRRAPGIVLPSEATHRQEVRPGLGAGPLFVGSGRGIDSTVERRTLDSVNLGSKSRSPSHTTPSNRCVFVVSSLAGKVLILPRVSAPANASAATRDAKCLGVGRERPPGLLRPFSGCRMWSVSSGF